ncbi:hypothetical protein NPIL_3761 [Nephila pilipes]|uniref:Uncharacterized protein n=1 Tax=Nephila pilipes TaxID=299642 RepID=A0A8X6MQU9_NEPPI|nr:hypothetical protein NPIL_3761 [Nephila pilipes]
MIEKYNIKECYVKLVRCDIKERNGTMGYKKQKYAHNKNEPVAMTSKAVNCATPVFRKKVNKTKEPKVEQKKTRTIFHTFLRDKTPTCQAGLYENNVKKCPITIPNRDGKVPEVVMIEIPKIEKPKPAEERPCLLTFRKGNERPEKSPNDSSAPSILVGFDFCVREFIKYLNSPRHRAEILGLLRNRLNKEPEIELMFANEETNWQYHVNKDLVRIILETSLKSQQLKLDNQWQMIKRAIKIAEKRIWIQKSRMSFTEPQSDLLHDIGVHKSQKTPKSTVNTPEPQSDVVHDIRLPQSPMVLKSNVSSPEAQSDVLHDTAVHKSQEVPKSTLNSPE